MLDQKFSNLPARKKIIENICHLAEVVTDSKIYSIYGGENIVCKLGTLISNIDNNFWDVWDIKFGNFEVNKSNKIIFQTQQQIVVQYSNIKMENV